MEIITYLDRKKITEIPFNLKEKIELAKQEEQDPIILYNTGSYCPAHRGHCDLLLKSQAFLETNFKYKVIAAFISPSNDFYVKQKSQRYKFSDEFIPFVDRVRYLKLVIEDQPLYKDFIYVDPWEGSHEKFIDYGTVVASFQSFINEIALKNTVSVILCLGSDMLKGSVDKWHKSFSFQSQVFNIPLCLVERKKNNKNAQEKLDNFKVTLEKPESQLAQKIFLCQTSDNEISSTIIRDVLNGQNTDEQNIQLIHPVILQELMQKKNEK